MTTLKNLFKCYAEPSMTHATIILYLYLCTRDGDAPTMNEIQECTELHKRTIKSHLEILEILKVLKRGDPKGSYRRRTIKMSQVSYPTPPVYLSLILNIVNIPKQHQHAREVYKGKIIGSEGVEERNKGGGVGYNTEKVGGIGRFTLDDVKMDADWKRAKPSLAKYFTPREIHPMHLVTKKKYKFSKFMELFLDDTVDFEMYCGWYSEQKYADKGFNYGLFLYPDMVQEYREYIERVKPIGAVDWGSEENKQRMKDTDDFIDSLPDD